MENRDLVPNKQHYLLRMMFIIKYGFLAATRRAAGGRKYAGPLARALLKGRPRLLQAGFFIGQVSWVNADQATHIVR